MNRFAAFPVSLLVVFAGGCSCQSLPSDATTALRNGTSFELLSLDPGHERDVLVGEWEGEVFHNQAVIGSTVIDDAAVRTELLDALDEGIAANDPNVAAACFWPRHGIRVMYEGEQHEFVICFKCLRVHYYIDDDVYSSFGVAKIPKPVFDKVLQDAGVPLPAK